MKFTIILIPFLVSVLACMTPAVLLPLSTPTAESVNTAVYIYVTSTPTVTHYCFGIVQVESLNLRERPSYYAPADGKGLTLGQVVAIIGTFGDWYQVETADGRSGYARMIYVNPCNP